MTWKFVGVVVWLMIAAEGIRHAWLRWRGPGPSEAPPPSPPPRTLTASGACRPQDARSAADIQQLGARVLQEYNTAVERKLEAFVAAGYGANRVQRVTYAHCPECHGLGSTSTVRLEDGRYQLEIAECSRCPGYVIDWDQRISG